MSKLLCSPNAPPEYGAEPSMDVALVSADSYTALPGTVQLVSIDGRAVYGEPPESATRKRRKARVEILLDLGRETLETTTQIAMLETAFSSLSTDSSGRGTLRRYQLRGVCFEDYNLPHLVFGCFGSTWRPGGVLAELLFDDYPTLEGAL